MIDVLVGWVVIEFVTILRLFDWVAIGDWFGCWVIDWFVDWLANGWIDWYHRLWLRLMDDWLVDGLVVGRLTTDVWWLFVCWFVGRSTVYLWRNHGWRLVIDWLMVVWFMPGWLFDWLAIECLIDVWRLTIGSWLIGWGLMLNYCLVDDRLIDLLFDLIGYFIGLLIVDWVFGWWLIDRRLMIYYRYDWLLVGGWFDDRCVGRLIDTTLVDLCLVGWLVKVWLILDWLTIDCLVDVWLVDWLTADWYLVGDCSMVNWLMNVWLVIGWWWMMVCSAIDWFMRVTSVLCLIDDLLFNDWFLIDVLWIDYWLSDCLSGWYLMISLIDWLMSDWFDCCLIVYVIDGWLVGRLFDWWLIDCCLHGQLTIDWLMFGDWFVLFHDWLIGVDWRPIDKTVIGIRLIDDVLFVWWLVRLAIGCNMVGAWLRFDWFLFASAIGASLLDGARLVGWLMTLDGRSLVDDW